MSTANQQAGAWLETKMYQGVERFAHKPYQQRFLHAATLLGNALVADPEELAVAMVTDSPANPTQWPAIFGEWE